MAGRRAAPGGVPFPRARARAAVAALSRARGRPRPLGRPGGGACDPPRGRRARPRPGGPLGAGRAGVRPVRRRPRPGARRAGGGRARRGRARAALRRAGCRARARSRGGRPAPSRGVRRRGHVRRDAERPVHERLLLPLRILRLLEGQARCEPARAGLSGSRGGDRPARARGVGARGDRGVPAGRHPPVVHGRLLRGRRRDDQGGGPRASTSTRSPRSRSGRALPRSTSTSTRISGDSAISAWARSPGPPRRSWTTRFARSSARTRSRPASGSRCTTPRTGSGSART